MWRLSGPSYFRMRAIQKEISFGFICIVMKPIVFYRIECPLPVGKKIQMIKTEEKTGVSLQRKPYSSSSFLGIYILFQFLLIFVMIIDIHTENVLVNGLLAKWKLPIVLAWSAIIMYLEKGNGFP